MNDNEIGVILRDNWNRISYLSGLNKKNVLLQTEQECRVACQNMFVCNKEKDAIETILWLNEKFKKIRLN